MPSTPTRTPTQMQNPQTPTANALHLSAQHRPSQPRLYAQLTTPSPSSPMTASTPPATATLPVPLPLPRAEDPRAGDRPFSFIMFIHTRHQAVIAALYHALDLTQSGTASVCISCFSFSCDSHLCLTSLELPLILLEPLSDPVLKRQLRHRRAIVSSPHCPH